MTVAQEAALLMILLFVCIVGAIGIACERHIRRHPRNRRVRFGAVASRRDEPFKDDRDWQRLFRESIKP
jgi:cell division protein FtsL